MRELALFVLGMGFIWYVLPVLLEVVEDFLIEDITPDLHVHKWKYGTKTATIEDKRWGRDFPPVKIPHRKCTKCGQEQYRGMLPKVRNRWKNYQGGDIRFKTME